MEKEEEDVGGEKRSGNTAKYCLEQRVAEESLTHITVVVTLMLPVCEVTKSSTAH